MTTETTPARLALEQAQQVAGHVIELGAFLEPLRDTSLPLDFVSWHYYGNYPFVGPDGREPSLPAEAYLLLGHRNPVGGVGALALSSGQAATAFSIQNIARAGDNIVSSTDLYGGTWNLFANTMKDQGIEVRFVDPADPERLESDPTSVPARPESKWT